MYQEGDWGTTTFLVAIVDDGHTIVWKAHKALDVEAGQRFTMAAATVKAHETYKDIDQTVVTRPSKFTVIDAADEATPRTEGTISV